MVLILAIIRVLSSLEPHAQCLKSHGRAPSGPSRSRTLSKACRLTLTVAPRRVGPNRLVVALRDRRGTPVRNASQVELRLEALDADLGARPVLATAHGDGTYVLDDALFSLAGPWRIQLVVRRPDAFDARAAFRVAITADGARAAGPPSPRRTASAPCSGGAPCASSVGCSSPPVCRCAGVRRLPPAGSS